jgi:hypothetical protein
MIALLNPKSCKWSYRFPLSIMHVGAELEGKYPYDILDQNVQKDAVTTIQQRVSRGELKYLAMTVMPGPQLTAAIPIARSLRKQFPALTIIWGGYFATLHAATVLKSGYVDYVVRGPGEKTFLELMDTLEHRSAQPLETIRGLSFLNGREVVHTEQREPTHPDEWKPLPFHKIQPQRYLNKTYLGTKTAAYYSSAGCPFLCGFCAIASIYQARWLARSPELIVNDVCRLKRDYGVNAIEFFDENFFTKERRTQEFAERLLATNAGIGWWGEGRPDTVMAYSDETLRLMKRSGCKMIFFGAESSSPETLLRMHKGGTQTPDTVLELAERLKRFEITPEFSFVLGGPSDNVDAALDRDIAFIRRLKTINRSAEIILYIYAPVVFEDSELSQLARQHGFAFPQTLDEWLEPAWQRFDLRKTPAIPWLQPRHYDKMRSFERVLNGYYPTVTDVKLSRLRKAILHTVSTWRYRTGTYRFPVELRVLFRLFRYRQPELEGF